MPAGPGAAALLGVAAPASWLVALEPDARARPPMTLKTTVNAPSFAQIEKNRARQKSFSVWPEIYLRSLDVIVFSSGLYVRL